MAAVTSVVHSNAVFFVIFSCFAGAPFVFFVVVVVVVGFVLVL